MSTYATVFPSKAFGVLNIIITLFMVIMYVAPPLRLALTGYVLTDRWFTNITGTVHMLWTGALPGTANDFDERDFIRQTRGEGDEESADTAVDR